MTDLPDAPGAGTHAGSQLSAALRRAALRATFASSMRNTQPWRFELRPDELAVLAEPDRRLPALDPARRQLTISCGCAVFNARVALARAGFEPVVTLRPDPARPELMATITGRWTGSGSPGLASYDRVVELRHSNALPLTGAAVPVAVTGALSASAALEGASLQVVRSGRQRTAVEAVVRLAAELESRDPACVAELRAWPATDGGPPGPDARAGTFLVLGTEQDSPGAWLRAGQALERVLLDLTRAGYVAATIANVVEVPSARAELRLLLSVGTAGDSAGVPQVVIRAGVAPPTPAARRRRLVDVLSEPR